MRRMGSLEVSVVGLGCNNFGRRLDLNATSAVVDAALEVGINFFDTADVCGGTKSEEFLGGALDRHRDDVVIATKFGAPVDEKRKGATQPRVCAAKLPRTACAASGPTVSTSTNSIGPTHTCRSRTRSVLSTNWCGLARYVRSAARTSRPSDFARRRKRRGVRAGHAS